MSGPASVFQDIAILLATQFFIPLIQAHSLQNQMMILLSSFHVAKIYMLIQLSPLFYLQEIADSSKPDSVMESTTDAAEWKLEVERVLPLLKVHIRTDNKVNFFKYL